MDVSVRSYLTAGMAAVVGATAISLSPVHTAPALRAAELPASTVAEIALTGTSIPLETIAAIVKAISSGGSLQAGVTSLINSIGAEFVKEAVPVVTAAAGEAVKYLGTALAELLSGPEAPQIDFPALLAAVSAAIAAGNVSGAVQALTSGLSAPLTQISQVLFTPEFQAFVMGKVGDVLGALPQILQAAVQTVLGIDIKPLIDAISGLLGGIAPAASLVAAPRLPAAAAEPAPLSAAEVPAAVVEADVAPADDSAAKTPAVETKPEAAPVAQAAPEAAPAAEAAEVPAVEVPAAETAETTVATEVATAALDVAALETVAPVTAAATAPEAAASADPAPAPASRGAKPGPRGHAAAAKSADSHAAASGSRG